MKGVVIRFDKKNELDRDIELDKEKGHIDKEKMGNEKRVAESNDLSWNIKSIVYIITGP